MLTNSAHVRSRLGRGGAIASRMRERLAGLQLDQAGPAAPACLLPGCGLRRSGSGAPARVRAVGQQPGTEIEHVDRVHAQVTADLREGELRVAGVRCRPAGCGAGHGELVARQAAELRHHHVDEDELVRRGGVQRPRGVRQEPPDPGGAVQAVVVAELIGDLDAGHSGLAGQGGHPVDRGAERARSLLPALHHVGLDPHPQVIARGHVHRGPVVGQRRERGRRARPPGGWPTGGVAPCWVLVPHRRRRPPPP